MAGSAAEYINRRVSIIEAGRRVFGVVIEADRHHAGTPSEFVGLRVRWGIGTTSRICADARALRYEPA